MHDIDEIFGSDGPLARALPGFRARASQMEMARAVADALHGRGWLVAEAGTGTGKTFAYLIPALLSGRRVIVSTGTRTLQDQLFGRDLPLLASALGRAQRVVLLKGRSNYVCLQRLERPDAPQRAEVPLGSTAVQRYRAASHIPGICSADASS